MKLDVSIVARSLRDEGYFHHPGFLSPAIVEGLLEEIELMKRENYRNDYLDINAVYISDCTETRESHAMMISEGPSSLPHVPILGDGIHFLLRFHNRVLQELMGGEVSRSARSMFNFQKYLGTSKEVAEHFDGHYIDYEKHSSTSFTLKEGLLPRYVFVWTLTNQNAGDVTGTVLRSTGTQQEISPPSGPGDLLIFDNVRFRHRVPRLEFPRTMVGLRTFDHEPFHFLREPSETHYEPMDDRVNPGFISPLSSEEAQSKLSHYYKHQWPRHWAQIQREGALF